MELKYFLLALLLLYMNNLDAQINNKAELITLQLSENENFPNNQDLPVLLYKHVFAFKDNDLALAIEKIFAKNNWGGSWRNGVFSYQHYHSTAHEALGVYDGWAEIQLGGPESDIVRVEKGDLVVLPAGTSHKRIKSGSGFAVVGAYPDGQVYDMNYGEENEVEKAKRNISRVPIPTNDPVFGAEGVMFEHWK